MGSQPEVHGGARFRDEQLGLKDGLVNREISYSLQEAQILVEQWRREYDYLIPSQGGVKMGKLVRPDLNSPGTRTRLTDAERWTAAHGLDRKTLKRSADATIWGRLVSQLPHSDPTTVPVTAAVSCACRRA